MLFEMKKRTFSELMPIVTRFDWFTFRCCPFAVDQNIIHIFGKYFTYYMDLNSKQEWKEEHRHVALDRVYDDLYNTVKHGSKQYW